MPSGHARPHGNGRTENGYENGWQAEERKQTQEGSGEQPVGHAEQRRAFQVTAHGIAAEELGSRRRNGAFWLLP